MKNVIGLSVHIVPNCTPFMFVMGKRYFSFYGY